MLFTREILGFQQLQLTWELDQMKYYGYSSGLLLSLGLASGGCTCEFRKCFIHLVD